MNERKVNGRLILEEVSFNRLLKRKVNANNKTSGKISLPHDLIGKEVIVIIPKGGQCV